MQKGTEQMAVEPAEPVVVTLMVSKAMLLVGVMVYSLGWSWQGGGVTLPGVPIKDQRPFDFT